MKDIINRFLEKILSEKRGIKILIWSFIIIVLLSIVFYPIIDANFLYYNRTNKRIEIINKIGSISEEVINRDERIAKEYDSILNDMTIQRDSYISNIFRDEISVKKNVAKFIAASWLFIVLGFVMIFTIDKKTNKRFSISNILGGIICIVVGGFMGFLGLKIPNIFSYIVNIILYQIIIIFLAYTIATASNK